MGPRMILWQNGTNCRPIPTYFINLTFIFIDTGRKMKQSTEMSALEAEVAQLIVESLNLEDVKPEDIDPEAALFREGLGLDSIDALELALAISRKYGFKLQSDDKQNS